ncbi:MAG: sugar transferase [Pirellulaceae bacterium]
MSTTLLPSPDETRLWTKEDSTTPAQTLEVHSIRRKQGLTKRAIDLSVLLVSAPLILPLLAGISIAIKLTSRGPVFYRQKRVGRLGQPFYAWKFRTMVRNADEILQQYLAQHPELRVEWERDHKLKKDPRVTRFGAMLRKTSLDELPQLLNVLMGQMSLVGPRPIVSAEIEKYAAAYDLYIVVTPGLTGLWQVSGRNNTTYGRRIELDTYYVRHWSLWLDMAILMRTFKTVMFCEGAY